MNDQDNWGSTLHQTQKCPDQSVEAFPAAPYGTSDRCFQAATLISTDRGFNQGTLREGPNGGMMTSSMYFPGATPTEKVTSNLGSCVFAGRNSYTNSNFVCSRTTAENDAVRLQMAAGYPPSIETLRNTQAQELMSNLNMMQ
jgi:hypothetical protein